MGNYHARFYEGLGRGDTPSPLSTGNMSIFAFDGMGKNVQIVEKLGGSTISTKQFLWCGAQRCETRNNSGALMLQYFNLGQSVAGTSYFYTKDHLGSIHEVTLNTGSLQSTYEYDPYGTATQVQGSLGVDFQFSSYYYHANSGLNLTLNRSYSSHLGRWISRDPAEENGGINLYDYVVNDPINRNDPSGLGPQTINCLGA